MLDLNPNPILDQNMSFSSTVKFMPIHTHFRTWGPFPDKYIMKFCYADYAVITDAVLGQCFHRIIRF